MRLIKILFGLILTLVLGNITLTNHSVDQGVVVATLNHEIKSLENQNTLSRARIANAGSLVSLVDKIALAGFVERPQIVALPNTSSVALR